MNRVEAPEVRLLSADGSELGIVATGEARRLAEQQGLELLMIDAAADPPVCRLLDFGRFKYEIEKRERAERRSRSERTPKDMAVSSAIAAHDLSTKIGQLRRLLHDGHDCRLFVAFAGPAPAQREAGLAIVQQVTTATADLANVASTQQSEDMSVTLLSPLAPIIVDDDELL